MALSLHAGTRLLVIAPHPDDESIATGELIQQVRQSGGQVRIVLMTNGDNNPWPQRWVEKRLHIGTGERRRWGERRRGEVAQALAQLGVEPGALEPLSWPDMGITDRLREQLAPSLTTLTAALDASQPNLVAIPALGDHHPDHGAAHVLARLALAQWQGGDPQVLAYLVHGREEEVTGRVKLDSSVSLHASKLAALACHRSQMALSGKRMHRLADRPERYQWIKRPEAATAGDLLPWQPAPWLHPWLHLLVADAGGVRSWPWAKAPLARDGLGRHVLHVRPEGSTDPCFVKLHMKLPSPWIFDRWGWREL